MTLYEINQALRNALETIDPETGEIMADLDELNIQRAEKIEGIALTIKEDLALAEAIKAEADSLLKRATAIKNRAEWKKRYLGNALTSENGREKYASARVAIGWRKSQKVQIEDEIAFCEAHPNYSITKVEQKPDRKLIAKDLKEGVGISGAVLVETESIQIR